MDIVVKSRHCALETNTTFHVDYISIKSKYFFKKIRVGAFGR